MLWTLGFAAVAQTTPANLDKYVALSERLHSAFIRPGTGPGTGMPAHERWDDGTIRWADATIDLGWNLGVLATELALIDDPGRYPGASDVLDRTVTAERLHEGLTALERLDFVADAAFSAPCTNTPALNGFFIRDDIPADQHEAFGLTQTRADALEVSETMKEMSQDQVWHVLLGLRLVERYARGTVVDGDDLGAWAEEQAVRIMDHVTAEPFWQIRNPACDRDVDRGPSAGVFAGGAVPAMEALTGGSWTEPLPEGSDIVWESARAPDGPFQLNVDNVHMAMALAAIGDGWGETTAADLAALSETDGWTLYPLLHGALFPSRGICDTGEEVGARARVWLDELPTGATPRSPRPLGPSVHGWTQSNRFIRPSSQHYVGPSNSEGRHYHGVDYLLLHNLYALALPETWDGGSGPDSCAPVDTGGPEPDEPQDDKATGCGCSTGAPGGSLLFGLVALSWRRRGR